MKVIEGKKLKNLLRQVLSRYPEAWAVMQDENILFYPMKAGATAYIGLNSLQSGRLVATIDPGKEIVTFYEEKENG